MIGPLAAAAAGCGGGGAKDQAQIHQGGRVAEQGAVQSRGRPRFGPEFRAGKIHAQQGKRFGAP